MRHLDLRRLAGLGVLALLVAMPAQAQDLRDRFARDVTEFTLDNGLHFIIVERREAPVISFYTYADVGSVNEVTGITGLAHMFEHMAFKGTTTIGTTDIEAELAAMARMDAIYPEWKRAEAQGDAARAAQLKAEFEAAQEEASSYGKSDEFTTIIERNGGVGLNASTFFDRTDYFYSLPSNKIELWFSLESDRFLNPVLRDFYTERDVVMEERRMRTDNNPFGKVFEEFMAAAFMAHPYRFPTVGYMSDLQSFTRQEALDFFEEYYVASNLTIVLVGDVDPQQARQLAETYFGRLPKKPKPLPVETIEPPQRGERRVVIEDPSQPLMMFGWHKGSVNDADDPIFDVLTDILSNGRTSRFYRILTDEKKLALQIATVNGLQGFNKYPTMFLGFAFPTQGTEPETLEQAVYEILDDIAQNGVTDEELQRAKTRARAALVRQLQSNTGVGIQLAYYQAITGDWRNLFDTLDRLDAVTSADVQRVVRETLTPQNRTVVMIKTQASGDTASVRPTGASRRAGESESR